MGESEASSKPNSSLFSFEKLIGHENYNNWKFSMKMMLIHEDLWRCIDGFAEDDRATVADKTRLDQRALAKICLMMQPCAFPHVRTAETAKDAWQNLSKAYEETGLSKRISLIRGLVRVRLENFASIEDYVNEAMSLARKLSDIGHPVDDEFLGVIMLSGLTSEYDSMVTAEVTALESSGAKLTSDGVKFKLLAKRKQDFSSPYSKKNMKCFGCGVAGHFRNECTKH